MITELASGLCLAMEARMPDALAAFAFETAGVGHLQVRGENVVPRHRNQASTSRASVTTSRVIRLDVEVKGAVRPI